MKILIFLKILKFFKNFENFLKIFENFENFEARVFSHKKLVPQIRASFTHHARASYRHNFFFGTVQMTRGQRARVKSHQKFVPQIRASFTHHARASSTRRYACFTRGLIQCQTCYGRATVTLSVVIFRNK